MPSSSLKSNYNAYDIKNWDKDVDIWKQDCPQEYEAYKNEYKENAPDNGDNFDLAD